MKTIKKFLFLVAIGAAFVSCGDITIKDIEYQTDLKVDVVENANNVSMLKVVAVSKTFSKEGEVNLSGISEIKDRLSSIKAMKITKVTVSALDFDPAGTKVTDLTISFPDLKITKTSVQGNNSEINDMVVAFTAEELTKIQDAILKDNKVKYSVSGSVSNYPVSFTIRTKFTSDFTISLN